MIFRLFLSLWWPDSADLNLGLCDQSENLQICGHKTRLREVDGLFNIVMKANTRLHAYLSTLLLQPLCKGIEGQAYFTILMVKEVVVIIISLNIPNLFLFSFSPLPIALYKSYFMLMLVSFYSLHGLQQLVSFTEEKVFLCLLAQRNKNEYICIFSWIPLSEM